MTKITLELELPLTTDQLAQAHELIDALPIRLSVNTPLPKVAVNACAAPEPPKSARKPRTPRKAKAKKAAKAEAEEIDEVALDDPEDDSASAPDVPSIEEARVAMHSAVQVAGPAAVKEVLAKFKVSRVSAVAENKRAAFVTALQTVREKALKAKR